MSSEPQRFLPGLDAAYITPRIIAMACPTPGGPTVAWRSNDAAALAAALAARHGPACAVYDLTLDSAYAGALWAGPVRRRGFSDHTAPPLALLVALVDEIRGFLDEDAARVVAVHCRAGKGRTGAVVAACLVGCGLCATAAEALELFRRRRSPEAKKGVDSGSQRRYVGYYEAVHTGRVPWTPSSSCPATLRSVRLAGLPRALRVAAEVVALAFPHDVLQQGCPAVPRDDGSAVAVLEAPVDGDLMVRVYEEGEGGGEGRRYVLRAAVNTHFVARGEPLRLSVQQMDGGCTGRLHDARLPADFSMELLFV
eukprot:m51a1_g295 putative phosphatidylinositol- -trisphosphate 3- (310) ;mRNA; f:356248-357541